MEADRLPWKLGNWPPELYTLVAHYLSRQSLFSFASVNGKIRFELLPLLFKRLKLHKTEKIVVRGLSPLVRSTQDESTVRLLGSVKHLTILLLTPYSNGDVVSSMTDQSLAGQLPVIVPLMSNLTSLSLNIPFVSDAHSESYVKNLHGQKWQISNLQIRAEEELAAAIIQACKPSHLKALQMDEHPGSLAYSAAAQTHGKTLATLYLEANKSKPLTQRVAASREIGPVASDFPNLQSLFLFCKDPIRQLERRYDTHLNPSGHIELNHLKNGLRRLTCLRRFGCSFNYSSNWKRLSPDRTIHGLCKELMTEFAKLDEIYFTESQTSIYQLPRSKMDSWASGQTFLLRADGGMSFGKFPFGL